MNEKRLRLKKYTIFFSVLYVFFAVLSIYFLIDGRLNNGDIFSTVVIITDTVLFPVIITFLNMYYHLYKDEKYYLNSSFPSYLVIFYLFACIFCVGIISAEGKIDGFFALPFFFGIGAVVGFVASKNQFLEKHYLIDKPIVGIPFILIVLFCGLSMIYNNSATYQKSCMTRIDKEIQQKVNDSVLDAQIHLIDYDKKADYYGVGCSGVIVKRVNDTYYVITAAHCIPDLSMDYYIITNQDARYDTLRQTDAIGMKEYYADKPVAKIINVDREKDLALLSFQSEQDLRPIVLALKNPSFGEHIISIGNPEDDKNYTTYGTVISRSFVPFRSLVSQSHKVFQHNAYIKNGCSGCAVLNKDMELIGINIGEGANFFHHFRFSCAIPLSVVKGYIHHHLK